MKSFHSTSGLTGNFAKEGLAELKKTPPQDLVRIKAGQLPKVGDDVKVTGKVGAEVSLEVARGEARICTLQGLACLRQALGSLDRVRGIAKVDVFVASAPGFTDQSKVANGASDLLVEVFGDDGRHARAAVGVPELPLGAAVEVALVAVVAED